MPEPPGWCQNMLSAAGVQAGEKVRVIVDQPFLAEGEALAAAARAADATAWIVCFPPERPLQTPTAEMLESAAWADVSLGLLRESYAEELLPRRQMLDVLLAHRGRALSSDTIDHETLFGELSQPVPNIEPAARSLLAALAEAREVRVQGAAGTDVILRVDGRRWLEDCLPLAPGGVANFPGGEVCIAPLGNGADGVVVVDLTIPWGPEQGLLPEPVTLHFERGRVVEIEGGAAAERLRALVEEAGAGADVIAELGLGLNPTLRPRGHVLFDEKAAGTAHIAIGNNTGPYGGDNRAAIHIDCVFSAPSLTVDGRIVDLP